MASAPSEDDKSKIPAVSCPLAKRKSKPNSNETDPPNPNNDRSKLETETGEVRLTSNTPTQIPASRISNLSNTNLVRNKSDREIGVVRPKKLVANRVSAIETGQVSPGPNIHRSTSAQEPHSNVLERKPITEISVLSKQDELPIALPKPNIAEKKSTREFCNVPPPLPPKGASAPTPPPRPNLVKVSEANLPPNQDCEIHPKVDFSTGCEFCGQPDDDNTDAAFCKVCMQYYCLLCLISHQKCNSTKDHEITYKFVLKQTDDAKSISGMSDEYKSLENVSDAQESNFSNKNENTGKESPSTEEEDDEIPIQFCDQCENSQENRYIDEAVASCKECNKRMCSTCLKVHHQDRNKEQHNIVNLQQKKMNTQLEKFLNKIKCGLHPEWSRRYFCGIHREVICTLCKADNKHADCTEVIVEMFIASSMQNIDKSVTNRKLNELTYLSDALSRLNDITTTSLKDMGLKRKEFKEKLKKQQEFMESHLDLAVQSSINKINNTLDAELELLRCKETENQNIKSLFQRQISEYDKLLLSGTKEEMFIMQTSVESNIQKFEIILTELQSPINACFTMIDMSDVDRLQKETELPKELIVTAKIATQRPILDKQAVCTDEVCLSDFSASNVIGMEILQDEKVLVVVSDKATQKIIMFDQKYNMICALKLNSTPSSMAVISNGSIFVALPTEKCLQEVDIDKKQTLSMGKTVKTKLPCLQISKFNIDLVAVVKDALCNCIVTIDTEGTFRSRIFIDKDGMLQDIQFMTVNQAHSIIYITEKTQGCIGISVEGDIIFKYKADDVQIYKGVCSDPAGNVYLAEKDADNVVVVNKKCENVMDIVTMKGLQPQCITFKHADDTLVIHSHGMINKVRAFKLI